MNDDRRILYLNSWTNQDRNVRSFLPELVEELLVICPEGRQQAFIEDRVDAIAVPDFSIKTIKTLLDRPLRGRRFEIVLADAEDHMEAAAFIRESLGIPGQTLTSARTFRDKKLMLSRLEGQLRYFRCPRGLEGESDRFVVKMACGTDSARISVVDRAGAEALVRVDADLLIQEFVPYPVFHVDCLYSGTRVLFHSVTRYEGTCLQYRAGAALGGTILLDGAARARFLKATEELLSQMPASCNMICHAEFFYDSRTDDMVFCEVGGRSGGGCGIVVQSIVDTYGVHLTREFFLM